MGADFCFAILPICKMNPQRLAEARALIVDDEDYEVPREDILSYLECYDIGGYEDLRTVGHLHLDGLVHYITGGMSWGDPPTDEYDEFNRLDNQIGHLLLQWAKEDREAKP